MLACAHCGVHLPRDEALPGRGGVFCGDAHRTAFEQAHPNDRMSSSPSARRARRRERGAAARATSESRPAPSRRRAAADAPLAGRRRVVVRRLRRDRRQPGAIEDSRFAASWQTSAAPRRRRGSRSIAETTFERIYRRLHRRARRARRRPGRDAGADRRVRPAADAAGRRGQHRLCDAGDQHVAAAALSARRRAAGVRAAAAARNGWRRSAPTWCCFTALHLASPGSSLNYVALLVLPVLMAGVLTPRVLALATAAPATLVLLGTAWLGIVAGGDATLLMTQAGLAGSGFFVITVLAGELAGRLAREELSARGSLEMARQQAQLNRLVIEEMEDGVLVVDRARQGPRGQPGGAAPARAGGIEPRRAVPAARRAGLGRARPRRSSAPSARRRGRRPAATWRSSSPRLAAGRCACASASRASASRRRARSSACCSSRTCATCRRAAARKSSPRWAASRPASPTRSAIRSRRSPRPMRCSPRTRPIRRSAS